MPASNVAAEKRSQPQILVETAGLSEEEWLAYRRKGIGGSDVAALLGISPWRTARDLYFDKLNIVAVEDNEDNWVALEMGHLLEPLVAKIFQHRTGYKVYQIKKMFQHPQYSWMLADVDYFVELPDGSTAILEIKTTNYNARDNWWLNGEETVPVYYETQGRHYMAVMNVDRCFFCCLYGNNEEETIIREIRRDESYEEEMIFLEQYFWENHVLTRTPPPYTEDGDLVLESVRRHTGSADQDAPVVTLDLSLTAKLMRYLQLQEQKKLTEAGSKEIEADMADNLQMLGASMDKANSIDDTPVMDIDGAELRPEDASVRFEDVSFSYGERIILDHVSLTVPAGSTTAVVGPSGGGKTTLCNLIARFWDVQGGRITVGGHDVREYKLDSLMKNISMVFQSVYLFNDTVENNIKFGRPDATHEQVVAAAKAACCHDFIMALPDGYDTVLGEGGGSLSGGEKQRISIARAMLKDAPIVILDEATASVDPENEAELQAAISSLTKGKTLILIAHRLKTVRNADQILVLNGGHIVQRGTHEELIAQPGLYADFVHVRAKANSWKLEA